MRLCDWAKQEGIAYITAWRWFKHGKLPVPAKKTPSGAILVDVPQQKQERQTEGTWVYARVSSHDKRDDLKRQAERCVDFCAVNGWAVRGIVKEVASGMNDSRAKLIKLLKARPERIVVEHKDRLTRFGFRYFEELLPQLGCELVVMNRDAEAKDDLIKDLIAVVTSFCCRLYGMRRGRKRAEQMTQGIAC